MTGTAGVVGYADDALGDLGVDRDYFTGELGLQWQFARKWFLSGGYRYIWRDNAQGITEGRDPSNNQFRIGLAWRGIGSR